MYVSLAVIPSRIPIPRPLRDTRNPAFGLKSNGIDSDSGVQALFARSHTASFEAIRNHKVDAGELS